MVPSAGPPVGGWMQRAVRVQKNSPPPQGPQPAPGRRVHAGRSSYPSIAAPWADGLCSASPEDLPTCFSKRGYGAMLFQAAAWFRDWGWKLSHDTQCTALTASVAPTTVRSDVWDTTPNQEGDVSISICVSRANTRAHRLPEPNTQHYLSNRTLH